MSEHSIVLIPENPDFVPTAAAQSAARDRFASIAPAAREIAVEFYDRVVFFDCGENFERVLCPGCRAELPTQWWQERMDADYSVESNASGGFALSRFHMPCCAETATLNDLVYEWPQGFGRFALVAIDPNIGKLTPAQEQELSALLSVELRVIYRMY